MTRGRSELSTPRAGTEARGGPFAWRRRIAAAGLTTVVLAGGTPGNLRAQRVPPASRPPTPVAHDTTARPPRVVELPDVLPEASPATPATPAPAPSRPARPATSLPAAAAGTRVPGVRATQGVAAQPDSTAGPLAGSPAGRSRTDASVWHPTPQPVPAVPLPGPGSSAGGVAPGAGRAEGATRPETGRAAERTAEPRASSWGRPSVDLSSSLWGRDGWSPPALTDTLAPAGAGRQTRYYTTRAGWDRSRVWRLDDGSTVVQSVWPWVDPQAETGTAAGHPGRDAVPARRTLWVSVGPQLQLGSGWERLDLSNGRRCLRTWYVHGHTVDILLRSAGRTGRRHELQEGAAVRFRFVIPERTALDVAHPLAAGWAALLGLTAPDQSALLRPGSCPGWTAEAPGVFPAEHHLAGREVQPPGDTVSVLLRQRRLDETATVEDSVTVDRRTALVARLTSLVAQELVPDTVQVWTLDPARRDSTEQTAPANDGPILLRGTGRRPDRPTPDQAPGRGATGGPGRAPRRTRPPAGARGRTGPA